MAAVSLKDVKKSYGALEVIHGVSARIADGEFVVIVGPSGCGKSTLLRMVAGLERISSGEVSIGERVVNELEPKDRDIAMVFQNYALYPHMSVYENMSYGLRIKRFSKADIEARVRRAAGILELEPYLQRKPRELSGGQRQRVAMGRAIVREPAVFLFDEPLSNLDAKLRTQMRVEIHRLQDRLGITSLYVTHDQVEAMTLADRMMVMNGGVAEQIGTPMEVYHHPASTFVAGFIGSPAMNFLPATLTAEGVELRGGHKVPLSDGTGGSASTGREVTLGIRPEHLTHETGQGIGDIAVQVELVEALGADTVVHARLASSGDPLLARLPGSAQVKTNDTLHFAITPGEVHLFDRDTGRRV
jgi:sn-glycerol 3-phosphate transport system ATP-binding protein